MGQPMSSRAIVSLGVWILAMVLIGTLTVGVALLFYVALTAFFAVVVAILMLVTRQRDNEHKTIV
ncbi:hypothetical protein [Azospirillum argentinense]|nr:hypothetical protein [Azospirillum argentinense]